MIVVDELGFHQATSAAELLADRGCRVEVITNGMVVGQDLGVTLDLETWNVKAHAKGIRQSDRRGGAGLAGTEDGRRGAVGCSTTRPATALELACDWVVCAVPAAARGRRCGRSCGTAAPFEVHRVGDCLAPRRAHAAVIEGERVGAAL